MNEKTVSVETLKLSKKSSEYLKNRGVETVEDLMHLSMPELLGAEGLELWMAAEIFLAVGEAVRHGYDCEADRQADSARDPAIAADSDEPAAGPVEWKEKKGTARRGGRDAGKGAGGCAILRFRRHVGR